MSFADLAEGILGIFAEAQTWRPSLADSARASLAARKVLRDRDYYASLTPAAKRARWDRGNAAARQRYALMPPEQKQARLDRIRARRASAKNAGRP